MRSITCPTIFLKLSWLLSRVVMCLCVRTHFPLPCVCLFLKKKCEIGCTCRIYLRGNIFSLTIYNFARSIIFFSLKLSHLLSHSICRFTLGPQPYKNTWNEKCGKLDEVIYTSLDILFLLHSLMKHISLNVILTKLWYAYIVSVYLHIFLRTKFSFKFKVFFSIDLLCFNLYKTIRVYY